MTPPENEAPRLSLPVHRIGCPHGEVRSPVPVVGADRGDAQRALEQDCTRALVGCF
jgi:hypothetical protein